MKNKEIIIDGVDIAGCEFAVKPINDNRIKCHCAKGLLQIAKMQEQPESIKSGLCENNHNCHYKQRKRKEQECEELKKDRERWKSNFNGKISAIEELLQQLDQLKVENEILKEKLFISSNSDKKTLKIIQTLTEIKEIAETISLPMGTGKSGNRVILAKQIIQKISEVME